MIDEKFTTNKFDHKVAKEVMATIAKARKQVKEGKTFSEKEAYKKLDL